MLPDGRIEAHRIWKRFRADKRRRLLRDHIEHTHSWLRRPRRRGWRWALRDAGFVAEPGDSIGLVGANGSGKSTLLKVLTRVMYPYAGEVKVQGRVGALIEVRAGIHPELTGRENTYLYGTLLGFNRRDVMRRFDEIVEFAELQDAIDRQVKYYSSGMQMRLGFAVAAFLEPDVLLVDEVLAVGDAAFQQRCLDRMGAVLAEGTTLVFVSHDLAAVEAVCSRGLWLDQGMVQAEGPIADVLGAYRLSVEEGAEVGHRLGDVVQLVKAEITGGDGQGPQTQRPLDVSLVFEAVTPQNGSLFLGLCEAPATPIFLLRHDVKLGAGLTEVRCGIPRLPLPRGRYYLWIALIASRSNELLPWHPVAHLDVVGPKLDRTPRGIMRLSPVHVEAGWDVGRP